MSACRQCAAQCVGGFSGRAALFSRLCSVLPRVLLFPSSSSYVCFSLLSSSYACSPRVSALPLRSRLLRLALSLLLLLWIVDTHHWCLLPQVGHGPSGRRGQASVRVGNYMIVYGGMSYVNKEHIFHDELHALSLVPMCNTLGEETFIWGRMAVSGARQPPAMSGAKLLRHGSELFLFGGGLNKTALNVLWRLQLREDLSWWSVVRVDPHLEVPAGRVNHHMAVHREGDPTSNRGDVLVLFGGQLEDEKDCGDMWVMSLHDAALASGADVCSSSVACTTFFASSFFPSSSSSSTPPSTHRLASTSVLSSSTPSPTLSWRPSVAESLAVSVPPSFSPCSSAVIKFPVELLPQTEVRHGSCLSPRESAAEVATVSPLITPGSPSVQISSASASSSASL
jgi:hypothetical protein